MKVFNPNGLPVYNLSLVDSPKVQELRYLALWSEGMLWCSPELHGNMSGVFKNQIDWIPLSVGSLRPTQGRTLALMQVNGGSQSFNVVNNIRMFTIPNQSPIPKASDQRGLLIESAYKDRVIDVLEELFKLTLLLRDQSDWLTQRYSENKPIYQAEAAIIEPVGSKKVACC